MRLTVITLLVLKSLAIHAQYLEVVDTKTRLDKGRAIMPTVYDGKGHIYLWGGRIDEDSWAIGSVRKYTIETKRVSELPSGSYGCPRGSGVYAGNDTLLSFGGSPNGACYSEFNDAIWKISATNPEYWQLNARLPCDSSYTTSVWDGEDTAYIIGGVDVEGLVLNTIVKYSHSTLQVSVAQRLPSARYHTSAVWDNSSNLYIFGGYGRDRKYLDEILKYDSTTNQVTKLSAILPMKFGHSCAVWAGNSAYIIGGKGADETYAPPILRFDPLTNEVERVRVDNFPLELWGAGCAYVEELDRIYIIGGVRGTASNSRNHILYVDLSPLAATDPDATTQVSTTPESTTPEPTTPEFTTPEPTTPESTTPEPTTPESTTPEVTTSETGTTSSTTRRPGGPDYCKDQYDFTLLPNPYCCESFFQCDNEEAILQHCPDFLQFNPAKSVCDYPSVVRCCVMYD